MATQAPPRTGFEKWQDGIDQAVGNTKWDAWDCEIQMAVNEFNRHLATSPGFTPLDWRLIKAMVWVETGANNAEWHIKPMQIGVTGDPGMTSLLSGDEGGDLILPPQWKDLLTTGSVRTIPSHNIRAGVAYLLMRMAHFDHKSQIDRDSQVLEVTVRPGDSLYKIANTVGSTVDTLQRLNPTAGILQPGQVLKYQKSAIRRVIVGWRQITTTMIAQRYNGGGDPNYARKLDHVMSWIKNGRAVACAA